jgi:hypothetical protein
MAELVPRIYSNFRGVDFRGEDINLVRSPDSLNMWKDYRNVDSIRTRPAMKKEVTFSNPVQHIDIFNGQWLVQAWKTLYVHKTNETSDWEAVYRRQLNDRKGNSFVFEDKWYYLDGEHYIVYDGTTAKDVEGYIPTTTIGRKPSGGGTPYEDVNMLTSYRINSFIGDGESKDYVLDAKMIDLTIPVVVYYNGEEVDWPTAVDGKNGVVHFLNEIPGKPLTDGQDNVQIKFSKTVSKHVDAIKNCTLIQLFDNRVFFSGNEKYPNMVWHSSVNDPTYVSDLDYYREGMDLAKVKGMVAGNNALWVFREPSETNTTVFYHVPTLDNDYGKIYPSSHSSVSLGCVGQAINFNDDIVFFSDRGMEGVSGDITSEQVVAHRSSLVDRKLLTESKYTDMILAEWEGYLLVIIGNKVYAADSRAVFQNVNHYEYEWFYWELEKEILCVHEDNGTLYLGCDDGIYTLSDMTSNVESYWVTPKDKFNYPHKLKTTNKRGCVAEATGDIDVYAKVEDSDFELIGSHKSVTDYFVSRIKRKKFKDIQLKFYSPTRFSLESVTLESFVGGYIKR